MGSTMAARKAEKRAARRQQVIKFYYFNFVLHKYSYTFKN